TSRCSAAKLRFCRAAEARKPAGGKHRALQRLCRLHQLPIAPRAANDPITPAPLRTRTHTASAIVSCPCAATRTGVTLKSSAQLSHCLSLLEAACANRQVIPGGCAGDL